MNYLKLNSQILLLFDMNQIVRSPGIYFENNKKQMELIGTIIPNQGSWISIKINVRLKN